MVVLFHDFKTEHNYDILTIKDELESVEIHGENYPKRVSFFSEDMWIDFSSDWTNVDRGFNLTLKEADKGE